MRELAGRIAVVTGGSTGMGRELVVQLAAAGCSVAACDVVADALGETLERAGASATGGALVTTHLADVSSESDVARFRDEVAARHGTEAIHLLFNNAGIAGGGSFVQDPKEEWDRVFDVDFHGVINVTRAFLPMLLAADEGHVVNTSSINGLWASIGPSMPHTSYSAAKFAVRGFTEALICDFRVSAPHLRASVVCPGHVGTSIVLNAAALAPGDPELGDAARLARTRSSLEGMGIDTGSISDDDLRKGVQMLGEQFRDDAPVTAAQAAATILEGVRANRWRILVGDDAVLIDEMVRKDPEGAYEPAFYDALRAAGHLGGFGI